MNLFDEGEVSVRGSRAREGRLDAQMFLPSGEPRTFDTIVKRDGRESAFDKEKIVKTIFRAASSIGEEDGDFASDLATAVTLYLRRTLGETPPTVDHVHDAVERGLLKMDQPRTALAYVRFRDRRVRIRQWSRLDRSAVFTELEEARQERSVVHTPKSLVVHTGSEGVADYDREAIVAALVRETGLDEERSRRIAEQVEEQIKNAKVHTLTSSLIRELVDAKLIEHGLEDYRRKHTRLGVPLYDARKIICQPLDGEERAQHDPEGTDRLLAMRVKREFALTHVFSEEAAEGHVRSHFYLHDLDRIDRPHSVEMSLEGIKATGLWIGKSRRSSGPAQSANALVNQILLEHKRLSRHFAGEITWDAVNYSLAPLVDTMGDEALAALVDQLMNGLESISNTEGVSDVAATLSLSWDVPAHLNKLEAIGPSGIPTDREYESYKHTAQRLAWAIVEKRKQRGYDEEMQRSPSLVLPIDCLFFRSPGYGGFLSHACEVPGGDLRFAFRRGETVLPYVDDITRARHWALQWISLNLPRLALETGGETLFEEHMAGRLETLCKAHLDKKAFMDNLFAGRSAGPLAALSARHHGDSFSDLESASFGVGLVGLNECVHHLAGCHLHDSEAAVAAGERIVQAARRCCDSLSIDYGIRLVLGCPSETTVFNRFAEMDLDHFGDAARHAMTKDPLERDAGYSPGVSLAADNLCTPMERIRIEGRFHPWLGEHTYTRVPLPETSPASLVDLVEKAFWQTTSSGIAFLPE